jgi:hypothetical protein
MRRRTSLQSHPRSLAILGLASVLFSGTVVAQSPATQEAAKAVTVTTPLKVTVTISRLLGEKRVSSLPYVLSVNVVPAAQRGSASLRMGTRVPIVAPTSAKDATPAVNYQDVGTSIDCMVWAVEGGGFRIDLTIDESSVTEDPTMKNLVQIGRPSFRSFRTSDAVLIRDGQTKEVTSVPDKLTGEVVKVDVALSVVK